MTDLPVTDQPVTDRPGTDRLVVLESFRSPRPTTNPYIVQLLTTLRTRVTVETFSWPRALFGRVDVFHIHWPEVVFTRASRIRTAGYSVLFALVLLRMKLSRVAIVRTAHNLEPHDGSTRLTAFVLGLCDRWTTLWIRLNDDTDVGEADVRTILHGHYRDWFAEFPPVAPLPGRLLFFGQVRPYKGIDALIGAFRELPDAALSLVIAGRPNDPAFGEALRDLGATDPRIELELAFVDDERLAGLVRSAELVVLPYQEMHNSGALLLALSLDRPVLVPSNTITEDLAREVGEGWVIRYPDRLTADALAEALATAGSLASGSRPDLGRREWDDVAAHHVAAFRDAVATVGGTRSTRGPRRRRSSPGRA